MTIRYLPNEFLKKVAPKAKVKKLVSGNLSLNRAVLSMISDAEFLSKSTLEKVALNTIKHYKASYKEKKKEGLPADEAKDEALNEKKALINRVQNSVVFQIKDEIHDGYYGEFYKWLPSSAEIPDPLHQLNYGKKFQIGKGEMPGDRYGCRCGMQIFVPETKLDL
jgi:hypothetical protein